MLLKIATKSQRSLAILEITLRRTMELGRLNSGTDMFDTCFYTTSFSHVTLNGSRTVAFVSLYRFMFCCLVQFGEHCLRQEVV